MGSIGRQVRARKGSLLSLRGQRVSMGTPHAHRPPSQGYILNSISFSFFFFSLLGLEDVIELAFVDFLLDEEGWRFEHPDRPEESKDTVHGFKRLRNVYSLSAGHDYTGRVTVPVLFDKKTDKIVNNESSDIIQMLNSEFNHLCLTPQHALLDLYPAEKKVEIDALNSLVYDSLNNGVYKAGFAQSQLAYDNAVKGVFETLEKLELRLEKNRWLFGSELTLADVRLFTTLIRFDPIYFSHFKCSKKMLESYKNLWGFTRDLFTVPNVASTIDIENARKHYFLSHTSINPFHILPIAREINYDVPHERRKM